MRVVECSSWRVFLRSLPCLKHSFHLKGRLTKYRQSNLLTLRIVFVPVGYKRAGYERAGSADRVLNERRQEKCNMCYDVI